MIDLAMFSDPTSQNLIVQSREAVITYLSEKQNFVEVIKSLCATNECLALIWPLIEYKVALWSVEQDIRYSLSRENAIAQMACVLFFS